MSLQIQLVTIAIGKFAEGSIHLPKLWTHIRRLPPVEQDWDMRSVRSIAKRFSGYDAAEIIDSPSE
jgi:hypothetical protein